MQLTSAAILVAGIAAQQAAATGWSVDAKQYSCPSNTNNTCSSEQSGGYDWNGLDKGSFSSYGSNSFSGFSCTDSPGKRDVLSKRGFQSRCISGNLDDKPSMSCSGSDSMSPETYHVSSSHDADVDCEYEMPDGSTCKETHACSTEGTIVQNSQCGGAKSVTFKPGKNAPSGCSIGIHSIGFNCGSASSSVPVSTATPSSYAVSSSSAVLTSALLSSSVPSVGYTSSVVPNTTTTAVYTITSGTIPIVALSSSQTVPQYNITSMTGTAPVGTAPAYSVSSSEASPVTSSASIASYSTSTIFSTSEVTITSCASTVTDCPADSTTVVTSTIAVSTTICPVTATETGSESVPAVSATDSVPAGSSSVPSVSSTEVSPVSSSLSSQSSYPTPETPDVLPSCMNTWLYETGCKDNSDSSCYCKDANFLKHVYGCISAWSGSDEDTSSAASYLMGICAAYVPSNPAIITACPSTVSPTAVPAPYSSASAPGVSPVSSDISSAPEGTSTTVLPSTITYYSTQEVTLTSCAADIADCPASSTQVVTSSVAVSTSVVTPSSAYSAPVESLSGSAVAPVSSAPVSSAPAATSTITLYSTSEVTVTSCGPEVTDCPETSTVVLTSTYAISTTVTVAGISAPTGSASSVAAVSESPSAPLTSAPASTSDYIPSYHTRSQSAALSGTLSSTTPAQPVTTLTYSAPATYPATYPTGISSGLTIPSSSMTTQLITTVTVPQVQFTTSTVTVEGTTSTVPVLAAGSPSSAPAYATSAAPSTGAAAPTGGAPAYPTPVGTAAGTGTSFGTSYAVSATGPSSSPISPYTGAGARISGASVFSLAMGVVAAFFVL